jgi:D-amino-acid dehydrogenase
MMAGPDVAIVGAGAIGAACALELATRGASVEVLERGGGWAEGCSAGNAGLIVPSYATPLATPSALRDGLRWLGRSQSPFALHPRLRLLPWLARFVLACARYRAHDADGLLRSLAAESLGRWAELAPQQLEQQGVLCVYRSDRAFAAARREVSEYAATGLRCEMLDGRATLEREPSLQAPVSGAVLYPEEAHGDPRELVETLGKAACTHGARLRTGVTVQRLQHGRLITSAGEIEAGRIVIAAGAATRRLAPSMPVIAGLGCSVDLFDGLARPSLPVMLHEDRVVITPLAGRTRLAGILELAPPTAAPETRRLEGVLVAARNALVTRGNWRAAAPWVGLRPLAPDGLPIVGALPGTPKVLVASAHAMLGLALAPATGRLIAEALEGRPPPAALDPARYRPMRALTVSHRP